MKIKYLFKSMDTNSKIYIPFIIQMLVVYLILPGALVQIVDLKRQMNKYMEFAEQNAIVAVDITTREDLERIYDDIGMSLNKYQQIYDLMFHSGLSSFNCFTITNNNAIIPKVNDDSKMCFIFVEGDFFDYYDLSISEGNAFTVNNETSNAVRLVLGNKIGSNYEVGDEYPNSFPYVNGISCVVSGILDKNGKYMDNLNVIRSSDNSVFVCADDVLRLSQRPYEKLEIFDSLVTYSSFFLDSDEDIIYLFSELTSVGLLSFRFENINSYAKAKQQLFRQFVIYKLGTSCAIFAFSLASLISNVYLLIQHNKQEYSVYLLCGATVKNLLFEFLTEFVVLTFWPFVVSAVYYRSWVHIGISFAFTIFVLLLCMSVPVIEFRRKSISYMIRREG